MWRSSGVEKFEVEGKHWWIQVWYIDLGENLKGIKLLKVNLFLTPVGVLFKKEIVEQYEGLESVQVGFCLTFFLNLCFLSFDAKITNSLMLFGKSVCSYPLKIYRMNMKVSVC